MRDKLFICHATPEDDSYAIWLASRLSAFGYDVWIDRNALLGGEKLWEEIDQLIRHAAAKVLLVYSKNICLGNHPGRLKNGVDKERSLAESVASQERIKDFILLLNIDGSAHNLFIGADRLVQIPFHKNWAEGLRQLLEKLARDQVGKCAGNKGLEFTEWYENQYIIKDGIVNKRELYYSTFWPIPKLPGRFYMYQFASEEDAGAIYRQDYEYPISKISNVLSSFSSHIPLDVQGNRHEHTATLKDQFEIETHSVLAGFESGDFPNHRDVSNHLKALSARVFHLLMKRRGMFWYEYASKRQAYFFTPANLRGSKVRFEYPYRHKRKTKNLIGKYLSLGQWHYAISCRPLLVPFLAFSLKSHLVFTTDGFNTWDDKAAMHRHRRAKGRLFFNEEWRDMLLGFLHGLRDRQGKIEMPLNKDFVLEMNPCPTLYWAGFGYLEPKSKHRQDTLCDYEEADEDGD